MIRGLPASIVLHAAAIGVGYVTLPYLAASGGLPVEQITTVTLEDIEVGEVTDIAPIIAPPEPEEVDPEEETAPEDTEDELPEEEVVPEDEALPEDEQDVSKDEADAPEESDFGLPEEEPEAVEPEPEEKPKPKPTPEDDLDNFLGGLDTANQSERETRKEREPPPPPRTDLKDKPAPTETRPGAGSRTGNTARLQSFVKQQVLGCWAGVAGLENERNLIVEMKFELDEDGYIVGDIEQIIPKRVPLGRSSMRTAVLRGQTAVRSCSPYSLPIEDYAEWRELTISLGPADKPT